MSCAKREREVIRDKKVVANNLVVISVLKYDNLNVKNPYEGYRNFSDSLPPTHIFSVFPLS